MNIRLAKLLDLMYYETMVTIFNSYDKCVFSGSAETYFNDEEFRTFDSHIVLYISNNETSIIIYIK